MLSPPGALWTLPLRLRDVCVVAPAVVGVRGMVQRWAVGGETEDAGGRGEEGGGRREEGEGALT